MGSCRLESLLPNLRGPYLEANLPEPLAECGFLFSSAPIAHPTRRPPCWGSGEKRQNKKNFPLFPPAFNFELVAGCIVSDSAVESHNPDFPSGTHLPAPGWSRNRVILPPHLTANLIIHPIIPPSAFFCRQESRLRNGRKYTEGGTKVLESNQQSFVSAVCPESRR